MTVVACPVCDSSHVSWSVLGDHLWSEHTSFDADEYPADCPECDYPLSPANSIYHIACLTDVDPATVWTGLPTDGCLCPVCGEPFTSDDQVMRHVVSHSGTARKAVLGGDLVCSVCGNAPHPEDRFTDHVDCLVEHLAFSLEQNGEYQCPYCDDAAAHEGELEWHIWVDHFDSAGFETTCPGCEQSVTFGDLKDHLLCRDDMHGPAAAQLFDFTIDECFLCDLSVRGPRVLHRHIAQRHLGQIRGIGGTCRQCNDAIEDGQVTLHYPCLAAAADTDIGLDLQPTWRCPLCNQATGSREEFITHLEGSHELDLFVADTCRVCGESLAEVADHESCLEVLLGDKRSGLEAVGLTIPSVLLHRPAPVEFHAEHPVPETDIDGLYRGLEEFVERERESAREEAWRRYEDIPLERLKYNENVILDLVGIGTQFHPRVDLQVVFERPVPEHEHDPDDLTTRFGIYPGQKVIVGADANLLGLPMEAEVTFVDDQTIGLAPDPERSYQSSELRSTFTDEDAVYHVVNLLSPTPYDRKREAIQEVQNSATAGRVVVGREPSTEYPRAVGSFYAGALNEQQKRAVGRALGEPAVCCIHGPPGTGKTRTLTAVIKLAVARGDRVLACAHSNQAIDNLLVGSSTLEEPDASSLHGLAWEVGAVTMARVGDHSEHSVVQRYYHGVDADGADIVGATTSAAAELDPDSFDLVVVDEATQADQPSTFIPLLRGDNIVLAGDHKQLPPFCSDETARDEQMHISLFEHLRNTYGDQISTQLIRQYRMNESIAEFPSRTFYDDTLEHGTANRNWQISDLNPIVGHHVDSYEQTREETRSKFNPGEAEIVAQQVRLLQMHDVDNADIGVITAYSAQISEIASALRNEQIEDPEDIEIDTIDSFQGAERDAIIVSFVRSNDYGASGFLTFPDEGKRRLNVALSRAKKRLVLIGDFATLGVIADDRSANESCAHVYQELYDYLQELERVEIHS